MALFPSSFLEWSPTTTIFEFPSWEDLTPYVEDLDVTLGRNHLLGNIEPSKLTARLDNRDSRFHPGFTVTGPYGDNLQSQKLFRWRAGYNLLSEEDSSFESSGVGGWFGDGGAVLARDCFAVQAVDESCTCKITKTGSPGSMGAYSPTGTSACRAVAGSCITGFLGSRSGLKRRLRAEVWFYNSGGGLIAIAPGDYVIEPVTGWAFAYSNATAPDGTYYASVKAYYPGATGTLAPPAALTLTPLPGAGSLPAGTYTYEVSTFDGSSREGIVGAEVSVTTLAPGGIQAVWTPVSGATGYGLYGRTAGGEQLVSHNTFPLVGSALVEFTDNGTRVPNGYPTTDQEVSGDTHYLDGAAVYQGFVAEDVNRMTKLAAGFESTIFGEWLVSGGSIASYAGGIARYGQNSGLLTAGGGDMLLFTGDVTYPVLATEVYTFQICVLNNGSPRNCAAKIRWFDKTGTFISADTGDTVNDGGLLPFWPTAYITRRAPGNAVFCSVTLQITGCGGGEQHFVDCASFHRGGHRDWQPGWAGWTPGTGVIQLLTGQTERFEADYTTDFATPKATLTATDHLKTLAYNDVHDPIYYDVIHTGILAGQVEHYWRLGETSGGGGAVDQVGSGNYMSYVNAISDDSHELGVPGAVVLDPDGAFDCGKYENGLYTTTGWGPGTGAFSVEMHFKTSVAQEAGFVQRQMTMTGVMASCPPNNYHDFLMICFDEDNFTPAGALTSGRGTLLRAKLGSDCGSGFPIISTGKLGLSDNIWHQAQVTHAAGSPDYKLYIDGVYISTLTMATALNFSSLIFEFGSGGAGFITPISVFNGQLDDISVWNIELTAGDVAGHWETSARSWNHQIVNERIQVIMNESGMTGLVGLGTLDSSIIYCGAVTHDVTRTSFLAHLQEAVATGPGLFFLQGDGKPRFIQAANLPAAGNTFLIGDAPERGDFPYTSLKWMRDDVDLFTAVSVNAQGKAPVVSKSTSGIAKWGERTDSKSTLHQYPYQAKGLADYLLALENFSYVRMPSVTVSPRPGRDQLLYNYILQHQLGQDIRIEQWHAPGATAGTHVSYAFLTEQIHHHIQANGQMWNVEYGLTTILA